jgi:anti-sigma-K factor RskA
MNYLKHRELCEKLAAAYVLGTLRGGAARRFAQLAGEHATLRLMVDEWETRLSPLAVAVTERTPPARLWRAIAARIAATAAAARPVASGSLWANLAFWRGLGVLGSAAAVALLAVLVLRPPELVEVQVPVEVVRFLPPKNETPPSYLAVLEDPKTHRPVLLAMAARNSDQLFIKAVDERPIASDKDLELWALPPGAKPRSLGVIGTVDKSMLKLAASGDAELGNIPMLAVSLEPKGGSPTGGPTGPVLYTGRCLKLW